MDKHYLALDENGYLLSVYRVYGGVSPASDSVS